MSFSNKDTSAPHVSSSTQAVLRRVPVTVYDPQLLSTMLSAFATACNQLPEAVRSYELSRRRVARRVFTHVDRGERNAHRLAYLAANDLLRDMSSQ